MEDVVRDKVAILLGVLQHLSGFCTRWERFWFWSERVPRSFLSR
jgi:hypothetical protein